MYEVRIIRDNVFSEAGGGPRIADLYLPLCLLTTILRRAPTQSREFCAPSPAEGVPEMQLANPVN
jgi:hypothetical protein